MGKTRTHPKKKVKYTTIDFECDNKTLKWLHKLIRLTNLSMDDVVTVLLALYVLENKKSKRLSDDDENGELP